MNKSYPELFFDYNKFFFILVKNQNFNKLIIILMSLESLGILSDAYRVSRKEILDWIN